MAQEIKIGVSTETTGAEKGVDRVDRATERLAESLKKVEKSGAKAEKAIEGLAAKAKRLEDIQRILSREFREPIGVADAERFSDNFERMRAGRGSGRVREFDNFESWYHGHATSFKRPGDAEAHRRRILARGMQGTGWAGRQNPLNVPPAPPGGSGGGGGGIGAGAIGAGMRFAGAALGVAGIATSISGLISMIAQGVGSATEEAIGIDTLKRRLNGFTQFGALRNDVRGAAAGLGIDYVESSRLAMQYAHTTGGAGDLTDGLRTAYGASRSFGVDPSEGVGFFGEMQKLGVSHDDAGQRKLALLIADAIERGGFTAKADEVLRSVAEYAASTARASLSSPNVAGYLSGLTSMASSGYPGLDPTGAAGIIGQANAAMMHGGAMGDASQTLSYAATARGYSPVVAQSLWAGGLFASPDSMFGKNPDGTYKSEAGQYFGSRGIPVPTGDTTNLQATMGLLERQYVGANSGLLPSAIQGQFGLQTVNQAMALQDMADHPAALDASRSLLARSGVDISKITNLSGIGDISKIAGATDIDQLRDTVGEVEGRTDVDDKTKERLRASYQGGDLDATKQVLAKIFAEQGQSATDGSNTRAALTDLKDALTAVGDKLLVPLDAIRDAAVAIASIIGPQEYKDKLRAEKEGSTNYTAKVTDMGAADSDELKRAEARDDAAYDIKKRMAGGKPFDLDTVAPDPQKQSLLSKWLYGDNRSGRPAFSAEPGAKATTFDLDQARREHLVQRYNRDFGTNIPSYVAQVGDAHGVMINNPGNLMGWDKNLPKDAGFDVFQSPVAGISAMTGNIFAYKDKHHIDTIRQMALDWAPRGHGNNDPSIWAANVSKRSGIGIDEHIDESNVDMMRRLESAIIWQEQGEQPYSDATLNAGIMSRMAERSHVTVHGTADVRVVDQSGRELGRATPNLFQMTGKPTPAGGYLTGPLQ